MRTHILLIIATILLIITSCNKNNENVKEDTPISLDVNQSRNYRNIETAILAITKEDLDKDEINGLMKMREEEKLAKDVYDYLYSKYGKKVFNNIMQSEEAHMFALKVMIDKYNLDDPVDKNAPGIFNDDELQEIYNSLIIKGNISLVEALTVGTIIEDLDINDLNILLASASNEDLIYVYENLNSGSRNHLRSFYPQVLKLNGVYLANYISQNEFDSIISSPKEKGSW